jgi:hypothetical protein
MNVEKTKVMRISRQPSSIQVMVDQNGPENAEFFNCSGSMITIGARWTCEIKSMIAMEKVAFNNKKASFTNIVGLHLKKKLVNCYIWSVAL